MTKKECVIEDAVELIYKYDPDYANRIQLRDKEATLSPRDLLHQLMLYKTNLSEKKIIEMTDHQATNYLRFLAYRNIEIDNGCNALENIITTEFRNHVKESMLAGKSSEEDE